MELFELSVSELVTNIKNNSVSPVELMRALLDRINLLEPSLKAWVHLDQDQAMIEAKSKEKQLKSGGALGSLHGVPIGVKDIYYTAGIPTTACSRVLADFIPDYDATIVDTLKRAGAIILGKTVTTEFACADPSPTINPWNAKHTPGGSSSGSAVAVSARMCPVALGSQTVGSVLRPASYNGLVGFKPTLGRVSRYGVIPVSWTLDTMGWISRTVEDAALLLEVLAGTDPKDPVSLKEPVPDYLSNISKYSQPKFGVLGNFFYDQADEQTKNNFDDILESFKKSDAQVIDLSIPDSMQTAIADQQLIMSVEGAAFHEPMFNGQKDMYQPKLREMLEKGLRVTGIEYSKAKERRLEFVREMENLAEQADVLITPSTPTPALADLSNTGNTAFQGPWTYCGLPTITIPSGLSTTGLPLGVQLIGPALAEAKLLQIASWCENTIDLHLKPPL